MEAPSELDKFLNDHHQVGRVVSRESSFTMAREEALRKISGFQLPFRGAWAVKVIQSVVAEGAGVPIRVDLTSREARFFLGLSSFTLDEFETAFHNPEPHPNRALRHLLSALWAAGIREKWAFQLNLPGEEDCLIWNGEMLRRVESRVRYSCAYLAVGHQFTEKGTLGWVKGMIGSGSKNAEILTTLSSRCYVCPVPLTVDGRRLDSLQHCPSHGWAKHVFPLTMAYGEGELQPVPIPPGTFEEIPSPHDPRQKMTFTVDHSGEGLTDAGKANLSAVEERASAPVPFLLSFFMEAVKRGKSISWDPYDADSMIYWVRDGVVVDEQPLISRKTHSAVACYLNAEGLSTDMTTFHLADSSERQRRLILARQSVGEKLWELEHLSSSLDDMVQRGKTFGYVTGGFMALAGVGMLFVSPLHGAGLIVGGAVVGKSMASSRTTRFNAIMAGIDDLRHALLPAKSNH
jgi:hypothetical protein